ncbi:MAG: hypothetical protein FWE28_08170 [Oscillospiraceae bacterium]|nr:hypothetical protein [Oscillospiraceae bacterium]
MKNFLLGELLGLVAGGLVWVALWALDIGSNTVHIADADVSARIIVALVTGVVLSFVGSGIRKRTLRKRKAEMR